MKLLKSTLLMVLGALALGTSRAERRLFANSAGTHAARTMTADGSATERHLLYTASAAGQVSVCGVDEVPLGNSRDQAVDTEPIAVEVFGAVPGTRVGVAAGAIGANVPVYTAASGRLSATGATGSYYVGVSLIAADAAGDEFEYAANLQITAES